MYKPDVSASVIRSQTSSVSQFHQQSLMNVSVGEAGWITARFVALTFKSWRPVIIQHQLTRTQSMANKSMTAFSLHTPESSSSM